MKTFAIVLSLLLSACATVIPGAGLPISGHVVDVETGRPIEGVVVILQVDISTPFQGSDCYHTETGVSRSDGAFRTAGWTDTFVGQREQGLYAYKPGYKLENVTTSGGIRLNMKPQHGSRAERLEELRILASQISCLGHPSLEIARVYDLIAQEAEALAETARDRKMYVDFARTEAEMERVRVARTSGSRIMNERNPR